MKKTFLAIGMMIASFSCSFAQFDLRLDLGYGLKAGSAEFSKLDGNTLTTTSFSYGAGLNIGLSGSMWMGDHMGIGLDLTDFMGKKYSSTAKTQGTGVVTTTEMQGKAFLVTPMVLLSAHNTEGMNPVARFGIVLGFPSVTTSETQGSSSFAQKGTKTYKLKGGASLGFYSGIGVDIKLTESLILSPEIFARLLTYAPKTMVNTQNYDKSSGGSLDLEKDVTFSKSIDVTSTSSTPIDPQIYLPFSSVGFKLCIIYRINNN